MLPIRDHNPSRTLPAVTFGLIGTNVLVFLYEMRFLPALAVPIQRFGLVPYDLTHTADLAPVAAAVPAWATVFTSMFLHGSFLHIFGNMLYLWIFGNNIEDTLGHVPFLFFYLGCGLVASLTHVLFSWNSPVPVVGASGAISGVLGAYMVFFPRARVDVIVFLVFLLTVVEVPAGVLLAIWFGLQFLNIGSTEVAWFAHIGGFAAGLAVALSCRAAGLRPLPPVSRGGRAR